MKPRLTKDDREALYICALDRANKWHKLWLKEMKKPEYKRDKWCGSYLRLAKKYDALALKVLCK
jgi:hypothetical protein